MILHRIRSHLTHGIIRFIGISIKFYDCVRVLFMAVMIMIVMMRFLASCWPVGGCQRSRDVKIRLLITMDSIQNSIMYMKITPSPQTFTVGILNLFHTETHIRPLLSTCGPQDYEWEQFVGTSLRFLRRILRTKLGLLLQTWLKYNIIVDRFTYYKPVHILPNTRI